MEVSQNYLGKGKGVHGSDSNVIKGKRPMRGKKTKNLDPLFQLFQHHMLKKSYEDSSNFNKDVAADYLIYLESTSAHIPFSVKAAVIQDLEAETHELLVKSMYGCGLPQTSQTYGKVIKVKNNAELSTYEFTPPESTLESETDKED
jgi:hypothetical protein